MGRDRPVIYSLKPIRNRGKSLAAHHIIEILEEKKN
jgi:hypothetical protein